jgi:uncharacterized caspase-like protein
MSAAPHTPGSAETGKRLGLVIGVNEAPSSGLPSLVHAVADAEAMADVLQQHCCFELLEPPLLNEHATSYKVKEAIRRLARNRSDDDFLLLYFSGHGLPMTVEAGQRDVFFITHDSDPIDVEEDEDAHFSMRWLWEKLYVPTQAGRVLVVLDCCFAGDIGRVAPDQYLRELQERISYYFRGPGETSGARSGGLRLALTATGHNLPAGEKDGHGLMTGLLLPALQGKVDEVLEVEREGQISLQRLHRYLQLNMPSHQQPSLAGDFAGRDCIVSWHAERATQLRRKAPRPCRCDPPRELHSLPPQHPVSTPA